jgi:capsular polysaccharide biosynthesis protein
LRFPKVSCIYGKTLILSASGGNNYYHWLFDILPRFFFFEKADFHISEIDQILMPYGSLAFQDEMLNIIGIPKEKVIPLEENSHFITEKLYLPSLAGISGNTPEWICKYLRNKINAALPDATCVTPQKIYISRKNAKYRKVINEEEVVFFLKSKGFEVIYSENYSFYEQVQIFQKARIIVAPHGAGLSNIVFCRSGTKIIECFDNNYINQCYWTIASHCRLDYYYIISNQSFERKYMVDVKKDIYIPVNELMETLNFATNQSN